MTINELFQHYYSKHVEKRCKGKKAIKANFNRYFTSLLSIDCEELMPEQVQEWHHAVVEQVRNNPKRGGRQSESQGEKTANRSLQMLRAMFNHGINWRLINCGNPGKAIKKFKEKPRDRVVDLDDEMPLLLAAIEEHGTPKTKEIFLLCLITAQRLNNVCQMEWTEIDFIRKLWTIPASKFKSGVKHEVPLVDEALEILIARRNEHRYVFPGHGKRKDTHLAYPYAGWNKVKAAAGIKDLAPHDLRGTHASQQAEGDASAFVTRDTLGHTDVQTTGGYAKPSTKKIRSAMQAAVTRMFESRKKA